MGVPDGDPARLLTRCGGARGEITTRRIGRDREVLFVSPLGHALRCFGVADALVGAPGVLVPEKHVGPRRVDARRWQPQAAERRDRTRLDDPRRALAGHDLFAQRTHRAVFPESGEVTADLREVRAVPGRHRVEHLRQRGNDEVWTGVARVPGAHFAGELGIGDPVVAADGHPHLHDRPWIAVCHERVHVLAHHVGVFDPESSCRPVEHPRVAPPGKHHQQRITPVGPHPPERLVTPGLERVADPVALVGAAREIPDPLVRERRHHPPGEPRDVACHRHRDRHVLHATQIAGIVEEMDQFFAARQPGHEVGVESAQRQVAAAHGGEELRGVAGGATHEIVLQRPEPFFIPQEAFTRQIAGGRPDIGERAVERAFVLCLHRRLQVGVADIEMRVIDEVDLSWHHRCERKLRKVHDHAASAHGDCRRRRSAHGGNRDPERRGAQAEPLGVRRRSPSQDHHIRAVKGIPRVEPHQLPRAAAAAHQQLLGMRRDRRPERDRVEDEPALPSDVLALDLKRRAPAGRCNRRRHVERDDAVDVAVLVGHQAAEVQGDAVDARDLPRRRRADRLGQRESVAIHRHPEPDGRLAGVGDIHRGEEGDVVHCVRATGHRCGEPAGVIGTVDGSHQERGVGGRMGALVGKALATDRRGPAIRDASGERAERADQRIGDDEQRPENHREKVAVCRSPGEACGRRRVPLPAVDYPVSIHAARGPDAPFLSLLVPIVVSAVAVFILSTIVFMAMAWHTSDHANGPDRDAAIAAKRWARLRRFER